jgi:hypothetical protein
MPLAVTVTMLTWHFLPVTVWEITTEKPRGRTNYLANLDWIPRVNGDCL